MADDWVECWDAYWGVGLQMASKVWLRGGMMASKVLLQGGMMAGKKDAMRAC